MKFTVDRFETEVPHFLDIEIAPDGLSIYHKDTNTGQYTNFDSYTFWFYKISWITSLTKRAQRICSPLKLKLELNNIKKYASWNRFPRFIVNKVIENPLKDKPIASIRDVDEGVITIFIKLPYLGKDGENLVKSLKNRLKHQIKKEKKIEFKVTYQTHKTAFYTNMKDMTPKEYKSNVVYEFTCPGCNSKYIGKTERNLGERCQEHGTRKESAIFLHIKDCDHFNFIYNMMIFDVMDFDTNAILVNIVKENTAVIDFSDNWCKLLIKEALYINRRKPALNSGLKASRELFLF